VIKLLLNANNRSQVIRYMHLSPIILNRSERELASMQKTQNIQDTLLNQIRREKQTVTFFLMNGFQLKGIVKSFDSFVVILETDGRQQMIYKHAISTIVPASTVDLRDSKQPEDKEHNT